MLLEVGVRTGRGSLCIAWLGLGCFRLVTGFAEFIVAHGAGLWRVPSNLLSPARQSHRCEFGEGDDRLLTAFWLLTFCAGERVHARIDLRQILFTNFIMNVVSDLVSERVQSTYAVLDPRESKRP